MTLANLCGWADRFESYLVENPEDRFSHDEAQLYMENAPHNGNNCCLGLHAVVDNSL